MVPFIVSRPLGGIRAEIKRELRNYDIFGVYCNGLSMREEGMLCGKQALCYHPSPPTNHMKMNMGNDLPATPFHVKEQFVPGFGNRLFACHLLGR